MVNALTQKIYHVVVAGPAAPQWVDLYQVQGLKEVYPLVINVNEVAGADVTMVYLGVRNEGELGNLANHWCIIYMQTSDDRIVFRPENAGFKLKQNDILMVYIDVVNVQGNLRFVMIYLLDDLSNVAHPIQKVSIQEPIDRGAVVTRSKWLW